MASRREFEGKDLEEALREASTRLGVAEPDLHYEIVDQGRRGVFGLGAKNVRIRVKPPLESLPDEAVRDEEAEAEVEVVAPRRPAPSAALDGASLVVQQTLQRMLDLLGLEVTARPEVTDEGLRFELEGADRNLLTQKSAELLLALQFVLNRMARRAWPEVGRIRLVSEGERDRRDEDVIVLAREAAQQVAETGRTRALQPMNAYERRLVHLTVREFEGLATHSEGEGPLKRVKIARARPGGARAAAPGRRRRPESDPGSP